MSGQLLKTPILTELSALLSRPVDPASEARARLHLLDWIGCAMAGTKEAAGEILLGQMTTDMLGRAFAWGGLGNILEMDDVDKRALLHPGPTIVPAAIAVALKTGASVSAILASLVQGYEATIRLGRAVGPAHYASFHSTGTCGAIGAAAASASLIQLDTTQTAHAMALAVSQSAGLWHTRHESESMGKQLHTSVAARAGVHAAILARDGFKGPVGILEGEQGFFNAMCPDGDQHRVLADAHSKWLIHDVSFKPWAACRHAHAVIDAALELKEHLGDELPGPIKVRTYGDALKFCDRPDPKTVGEAKFSLQHAVAIVLARGEPQLADFEPAAINAADVQAIRNRVSVAVSDTYDAVYPVHFGAEIEHDGQVFRVPDALGDPENPVTEAQIRDKARSLIRAGGLQDQAAESLVHSVLTETGPSEALLEQICEALT